MFDSGAATPELGVAKTITQIVYEQLLDKVHIRYGDRTKYLYTSTHRADIAPVLAEIKSVVEDVLARLSADFHDQEVYMAFEALSLSTWGALLASDDSHARQEVLMQKARRLWRALGLGDDWASENSRPWCGALCSNEIASRKVAWMHQTIASFGQRSVPQRQMPNGLYQ